MHRKPDRLKQKQAQTKDHWTKVEEKYLTRAFKEAREAAECYKGWKEEEMPGFHEDRWPRKRGDDQNYQRDH